MFDLNWGLERMQGGPNSCSLPCKATSFWNGQQGPAAHGLQPRALLQTRSGLHVVLNTVKFCFVLLLLLFFSSGGSPPRPPPPPHPQLRDRDVQLVFVQALYNADSKVSFAIKGHAWALWPETFGYMAAAETPGGRCTGSPGVK